MNAAGFVVRMSVDEHHRPTLVAGQAVPLARKQRRPMTLKLRVARLGGEGAHLDGRGRWRGHHGDAVGGAHAAAARHVGGRSAGGVGARPAGATRSDEAQEDREEDDRVKNPEDEDEDHCLVEGDEHVRVAECHY